MERFERLAGLSNGHRVPPAPIAHRRTAPPRTVFTKTRPRSWRGHCTRRQPVHPEGRPGRARRHRPPRRPRWGERGCTTSTPWTRSPSTSTSARQAISERFLVPVLEALIDAYPFEIVGFHADNGRSTSTIRSPRGCSTNCDRPVHQVAGSPVQRQRPGGGQVGAVIRHYLGRPHPPALRWSTLSPGGALAVSELPPPVPVRGAARRQGPHPPRTIEDAATPYEKLKSLPDPARFLKPGVSFEASLDARSPRMRKATSTPPVMSWPRVRSCSDDPGARMGPRRVATP